MKKLFSAIFCFYFFSLIATAQDYPDFGIPTQEEKEVKECAFDKEASAVVLIHEAFSYSEDNFQLTTTHHLRIKILKQSGVNVANITIPFYRENYFERIIGLEAITINIAPDGTITRQKVEKKLIYTTKINEGLGEINFAFPDVKTGSIIEYQYKSIMKNYWGLRDWYFQKEIPVIVSRYHLKMLPDKKFSYMLKKRPNYEATVIKEPGKIFFEMRNIPALDNEPYMDSRNDNIQSVNFQISNFNSRWGSVNNSTAMFSWKEVYESLLFRESFWPQIKTKISGTTDFLDRIKLLKTPEEKMKAVYNYVRSNMEWNNFYSLTSINGVKEAWQNKQGTSGDINLLLINLLKKAELEAYPILVSERFHGKVDTAYPFIDQFNSVFAFVLINNKEYYLDAAEKYTPAHIIPKSILNTTAFIVTDIAAGLVKITNDSLQYKEGIYLDMHLTEDGNLKGSVLIKSRDYARLEKITKFKEDKELFKESIQKSNDVYFNFENFDITNLENDSLPLDQKFNFSGNLSGSGEFKYISLNLFSGFDKNPFLSDNRFSNINFGYKRTLNLNTTIELPANYTLDELPKSIIIATPKNDIVISRQTSFNKENNTIYSNIKFEFKKSYYDADFYPTIKEAYKKLFAFLKEQVVLKKK